MPNSDRLSNANKDERILEFDLKFTQSETIMERLSSVIEYVPGGVCLYCADKNGIRPLAHNKEFYEIFGYSDENIKYVEKVTSYLNVYPEDLPLLKEKIDKAILASSPVNHTYRVFNDRKGRYIWVYLNAIIVGQPDGTKLLCINYTDVSEERKIQEQLIKTQNNMCELQKQAEEALKNYHNVVNTVPGGIAKYEVVDGRILTKYYNDGLCTLFGYTREECDAICKENALCLTYDDDIPILLKTIKDAINNKSDMHLTYRIKTKFGSPRYVNLNATYSYNENGNPEFNAVFSDIDEMKRLEEKSKEQQLRYEIALKSSGINIWEYDIWADKLTVVSNSARIKQNCFTIENYINSTIKNGYVREDSLQTFCSIFDRLRNGEKEITEDIWYKTTDEAGWWCERVIYTTVFDEKGKPIKAFGAGRDVTRERDAITKFDEEVSYRAAMQEINLASLKINLTQNTIIEGDSPFNVLSELIAKNNADMYFFKTLDYIFDEKSKKKFRRTFNRNALLNCFNRGDYSVSMEFARTFDTDRVYWIKYKIHLMRNPQTKDVIAFVIATDITDEKVMETIMRTVTQTEYDFFVVVDGSTNSAIDYITVDKERVFFEDQPFEARNEELIRRCVCPDDVEMVIANCKIENVLKKIQNDKVYKFNFSMRDKTGEIRRKQLQLTLINAERKTYLMTRIDVNSVYLEEQITKQRLEAALKTAEKASRIKTDFLARMSHDMRTPMNGILGLLNLTLEEPSLTDVVRDNLIGIYDSSQYLLSLINDTLDMNKIESNKLTLNPQIVKAESIINNIITFVEPMANEKNIEVKVIAINAELEYIKADPVRLQQIFVNILSNSIKFTNSGGKIEFVIECLKRENGVAHDRIVVRDNGIGMSKEFLPRLFDPFEQEQKVVTSNYSGTGLGMSIVKRLVELMGGTIDVKSELNIGTEVITYLDFERIYDYVPIETINTLNLDSLKGRRILLCEDHPLNAQIATKLLEKKGMIVDYSENGELGISKFAVSAEHYYDAILMDIRMPVIDGIEATKQIRALKRADSKTVPIIAMTANAFDDDVQKSLDAGMNAHLAKPIEPQKLFNTLFEAIFS